MRKIYALQPKDGKVITSTCGNALDGYQKSQFRTSKNVSHNVYRIGTGPAVIVIHEIPGITPPVAEFGRKIAAVA